jgi:FKBP-type peptidyl-prolyl cis-trans isomerase FkpA
VKLIRAFQVAFTLILLVVAVAGCSNTPVSPSSAPFSQTDLRVGSGTAAVAGSTVTVQYTGWFYDASKADKRGVQFDTSIGRTALTFTLGAGSVVQGWEQGLVGMNVGGLRRLIIPPSMAYGPNRYATIPPNTTLVFDIELLDVQ